MSTGPVNPSYYADFRGLDALKKSAREHDPQAVRQVARQFESLLAGMMLKSMREAKLGDGLGDSQEGSFYRDMLDQQIASQLSQGKGLGLADMLVRQLSRAGVAPAPAAASAPAAAPGAPSARAAPLAAAPMSVPAPPAAPAAPASSFVCGSGVPASPPASLPAAVPVVPSASTAAPTGPASIPEQAAFIRTLQPYAERAAERLGVSADALIAHAALETGWGRHVPASADGASSFNLFGIKAGARWDGAAVAIPTREYDRGVASTVVAPFRAYASLEQGIGDYVRVLQGSPRFQAALRAGADAGAFAQGLARGGYATDPSYAAKLTAVADRVRALRAATAAEPAQVADLRPPAVDAMTRQST